MKDSLAIKNNVIFVVTLLILLFNTIVMILVGIELDRVVTPTWIVIEEDHALLQIAFYSIFILEILLVVLIIKVGLAPSTLIYNDENNIFLLFSQKRKVSLSFDDILNVTVSNKLFGNIVIATEKESYKIKYIYHPKDIKVLILNHINKINVYPTKNM